MSCPSRESLGPYKDGTAAAQRFLKLRRGTVEIDLDSCDVLGIRHPQIDVIDGPAGGANLRSVDVQRRLAISLPAAERATDADGIELDADAGDLAEDVRWAERGAARDVFGRDET